VRVQEERMVGNDNCVSFLNRKLDPGESAASAFHQGSGQGASISRRWAGDLHGRLSLGRYDSNGFRLTGWSTGKQDRCPILSSDWLRARGCQRRFAPRCGGLA